MKAVILVGGFGSRLRPLTLSIPKPLVEFCNKEIVLHQIEALKDVGVDEVILTLNYQPEVIIEHAKKWERQLGIRITLVKEDQPLGTAGCIANCTQYLENTDHFFVLNADTTCKFPFKQMLGFHKSHGSEGTMLVTKVSDWSKFGVVSYDSSTGKISKFHEKPKTFVGDKINAGVYIFTPTVLHRLPKTFSSIEKEVFPKMAADGVLYSFLLESFWADLGTPRDYLSGTRMFLEDKGLDSLIDPSAKIGKGVKIRASVIGPNCVIDDNAFIHNSVILSGCSIGESTMIRDSIIGWSSMIGEYCHIYNTTVLGQAVEIADTLVLNNTYVLPHKSITENILDANRIVM